jgi:hypothetical protein
VNIIVASAYNRCDLGELLEETEIERNKMVCGTNIRG